MKIDPLSKGKVKMAQMSARIIRADGTIEELGTVAYYHKNPIKRLAWSMRQALKKFFK
jgi:hypothetical protein